jgi:ribosomal protein S18 acetylase RimI-like enzyme
MTIRELTREDLPALERFFVALPDEDAIVVKEDVRDARVVAGLADLKNGMTSWVALGDDRSVLGLVIVRPGVGWSSHVGELRLVVHPGHRRQGLGRALTRHALLRSAEMGLDKVLVEVIAEQEPLLQMFTALGFEGEAVLRDQVRDRSGQTRDVVLLAHFVGEQWEAMTSAGVDHEVGP